MNKQTDTTELEKAAPYMVVEILEYVSHSVFTKTILRKTTGNVTVSALDAGEALMEMTLSYDLFVQIIDGSAEVSIDKKAIKLKLGEGIIVPAHSSHCFIANEQFKMISTIIKSGYED